MFKSDLKYAIRVLAKSPGFTVVAVVTLALAIGVNSVIFGLVDAVLFRPLAVDRPEELVRLRVHYDSGLSTSISAPQLREFREQVAAFTGLAGFSGGNHIYLGLGEAPPEQVEATVVSGNFFSLLGVVPAAGRLLDEQDDVTPGAHPVLVLSHAYWQRRFGGDPKVIGSAVRMNTHLFTVVGVAPRGFHGAELEQVPDVWIPLTMLVEVSPNLGQFKPFERRGFSWIDTLGRLRPGVSVEQAEAQLNMVDTRIAQELKLEREPSRLALYPFAATVLEDNRAPLVHQTSWILFGVTGLVLASACAVAAGLLLARGEQRRHELAVRSAIGATRGRIVIQLMVESLVLAVAACALGLTFAAWGTDLFLQLAPPAVPLPTAAATPILASRALAFTGGLAALCACAFGLIPAWRASRANLTDALKRASDFRSVGRRWLSLRNAFVVTQVALSALLLVGAGLLLRTLHNASNVDLGFKTDHVAVISIDVSKSGYDRERGAWFYERLLDEARRLPGVTSAAIGRHVPVSGSGNMTSLELTSFTPPPGEQPMVGFSAVSTDFFRTLGIPLEQGRDFAPSDVGSDVLIVNRAFADRFWPGRDPLMERVKNFGAAGATVIGVARNVKLYSVRETAQPMIYVPDASFYMPNTHLVVRTSGAPLNIVPAVTALVRNLDPQVPIFRARTLEEHVGLALGQEKLIAGLLSGFGALALVLSAVGLYGVISYTAQTRTREFGIRLALGAPPAELLRLVMRQGAALAAVGLSIGLAVALAASRVLSTLLFGVSPTDVPTFLAVSGLLLIVALAASAVPARRAVKVDPIETLRQE